MRCLPTFTANLPALEAVLGESDVAAADAVVLPGDIALGPMPGETLDVLAELGQRAVRVHGNCERGMVTAFDGKQVPGPIQAAVSPVIPHRVRGSACEAPSLHITQRHATTSQVPARTAANAWPTTVTARLPWGAQWVGLYI